MKTVVMRLKEPSTYAGLAALALAFGVSIDTFQMYANAAAGLFAFVAVIVKDPGS